MQPISLSEAKAQLAGLVHAAEAGEVVHISRHGRSVAVLLSEQAYADLQGQHKESGVWRAIVHWRDVGDPEHADDWPVAAGVCGDGDISGWRDRSSGRGVSLG